MNYSPLEHAIFFFDRHGMEGFVWDHFATSVPMSTYLVAFVVANFTQVQAEVGSSRWKFNVYSRPSATEQTR